MYGCSTYHPKACTGNGNMMLCYKAVTIHFIGSTVLQYFDDYLSSFFFKGQNKYGILAITNHAQLVNNSKLLKESSLLKIFT